MTIFRRMYDVTNVTVVGGMCRKYSARNRGRNSCFAMAPLGVAQGEIRI